MNPGLTDNRRPGLLDMDWISITQYMTPNIGTSHSNEVIIAISGDASAVKAAVLEGRQTGLELLIGMGTYPEIPGMPYL